MPRLWGGAILSSGGGGAPICTTTRLGGLLDGPPGNSVGAYLYHTIEVWGIGGDNVGLIKNTKAPEHQRFLWWC